MHELFLFLEDTFYMGKRKCFFEMSSGFSAKQTFFEALFLNTPAPISALWPTERPYPFEESEELKEWEVRLKSYGPTHFCNF